MMQNSFRWCSSRSILIGLPILVAFNCSLTPDAGDSRRAVAQESLPNAPRNSQPNAAANHPLTAVLKLAKESRERLKDIEDYQCRFVKRDLINGRVHAHSTIVKFRAKPLSVYMRFVNPSPGREVIYVAGQNGGNLLAHEPGLLAVVGIVALPPNSPRALAETRHPITEFGLENLVSGAIAQWEQEAQFAASETEARFYPKAKLHNMECQVIETRHPIRRRQFPFSMTRLYIDNKTLFPVRIEQYGFPAKPGEAPPLIEEYTFFQILTNQGYADRDFDPQNPSYHFQ